MYSLSERHQFILHKLKEQENVKVLHLSKKLNVSSVTIRKDLKFLEKKGLLYRTHGGASRHNPYINERSVNEKEYIKSEEKVRIGKAAAATIEGKDSIIIASGTTVLAFARQIQPTGEVKVITASLNVASELSKFKNIEILQLGGVLRHNSRSVVGPYSEDILKQFSCKKLFLGIDGLELDFGLTTTSLREAQLNQQMIKASQKVILLADSSKFGQRGFGKICNLDPIDQIITDKSASPHYLEAFKEKQIEVTLV